MKKLHCMSKNLIPSLPQNPPSISITLASLFSTKTQNPPPPSFSTSLYDRIQIIRNPNVSVIPVLEQWVNEQGPVTVQEIRPLVRIMKDFRRFSHALEISQWMTDRRYFKLSPVDVALRMELIHRVHGLEAAEYYFNNISNNLKTDRIYGALLSGYVREKSVEKAEAIMQKMREMDMAASSFPYNMLINLYSQTGEHDKIDMLMQEMEKKGIPQDKYTMLNRMAAYTAVFDISGMERILNRMEEDKHFFVSWKVYSMAASGYLKVGLIEKALAMLKKMEESMPFLRRKLALKFLLTHYANTGHKKELYRVWNMYKPSKELTDGPIDGLYACMVSSLAKLGDIEGAEKIFEEWESRCTMYDFRVLNSLLVAYCKNGLLDKAESVVEKAVEGRTAYASTWSVLAIRYAEDKNMPKSIEMLKKALLIGRQGWRPNSITLANCLDHLEEQGDVEGMEELLRLSKNSGPLSRDMYHSLLRTCVKNGKSVSEILDQMKIDGFTADEETEKILGTSRNSRNV